MANFFQIPTPVGNGVGAAVEVTSLSGRKTFLIGGSFDAIVTVETSSDGGVTFGPLITAQGPKFQTVQVSATHVRLRVAGLQSGAPVAFVGSAPSMTRAAVLNVPAGNGPGAASDLSSFGDTLTFVVSGSYGGTLEIQASDDGTNWSPLTTFNNAGIATIIGTVAFARVVRSGVGFDPGLPAVAVAASDGDGGGTDSSETPPFTSPPEEITIYVRLTGNDVTGSGTLLSPYLTFERAVLDVPMFIPPGVRYAIDITGMGVINLPDSYAFPAFKSSEGDPLQFDFSDPLTAFVTALKIRATPALTTAVPAADAVVLLPGDFTLVIDPVTELFQVVLTVPRPSWANNALKGKIIFDPEDPGASMFGISVIAASTDTTLDLCNPDSDFEAPFKICDLTAELSTPGMGLQINGVDSIQFNGIKISSTLSGSGNNGVAFTACDLFRLFIQGNPGSKMQNWGCYWHDSFNGSGVSMSLQHFNYFFENFHSGGANVALAGGIGSARFSGGIMDNCEPITRVLSSTSLPDPMANTTIRVDHSEVRNSKGDGLQFQGTIGHVSNTRVRDSAGNAIAFDGPGMVRLSSVVGDGNVGFGVHVTNGGQVIADAATDVTGDSGDFQVGNLAAPDTWSPPAATTGTGDTIGGAAPTMTLTDAAATFTPNMVGRIITIAGSTTPENDGDYVITGWASATVISYNNPDGVAEVFPGTWSIPTSTNYPDFAGPDATGSRLSQTSS